MKFQTQQEQDLLKRLTSSTDFQQYAQKLVEDYEKATKALLFAPSQDAECRRGEARNLYQQLKDLGFVK